MKRRIEPWQKTLAAIAVVLYVLLFIQGLQNGWRLTNRDLRAEADALPSAAPLLRLPTSQPTAAADAEPQRRKMDLNEAEVWVLTAVPGVGEKLAQRIVDYRLLHGGFVSIEELLRIDGIGEKLYGTLREYLEVRP